MGLGFGVSGYQGFRHLGFMEFGGSGYSRLRRCREDSVYKLSIRYH